MTRGISTCVSGSPRRALNSSTRGPSARDHQPGEQAADERRAAPRELLEHRLVDLGDQRAAVERRHGRVGAHAARVRPDVAVAEPLEVLRGAERNGPPAVAEREQRHLVALEQLLDHARPAERLDRRQRASSSSRVSADEHALARCEPVGLEHARARATDSVSAVGTPAARRTSLANVFEPSIRAASALGPKTAIPLWRSRSATPDDERRLRPDHGEVDLERQREREQPVAVVGANGVAGRRASRSRGCPAPHAARSGVCSAPDATRARAHARPSRRRALSRGESTALVHGVRARAWRQRCSSGSFFSPRRTTTVITDRHDDRDEDRQRDDHLRPARSPCRRASARQTSTRSRAAPTPTSSIGTSSACSTNSTYSRAAAGSSSSDGRVVERLRPAGQRLPDRLGVVEVRLVRREVLGLRAVAQPVADAHRQLGERRRARRASSARATSSRSRAPRSAARRGRASRSGARGP